MACSLTHTALEREIVGLAGLPRVDLVMRWRSFYRADPPKGISRTLLVRAVAYQLQVKATHGLKPVTKRRLRSATESSQFVGPRTTRHLSLQPGTRLVREWNGVTYRVDVVDDGYVWNGDRYRSLSAVARAITGARWSGPRFFGLQVEDAS